MSPGGVARWIDRVLATVLGGARGDAIRGDLREEFELLAAAKGLRSARRWYRRQAASVALWALFDRARGRDWRVRDRTASRGARRDRGRRGRGGARADLNDARRVFRRAPGYAVAVVATLGLALGATLSVLTVVKRVLLTDLPYPEADRLIRIDAVADDGAPGQGGVSFPDFLDWRDRVGAFDDLAAWQRFEAIYLADGVAEEWRGLSSTAGLLPVVGVRPLLGTLGGSEGWDIDENVLFLSHALWTSRFGRDPDIVGRVIQLSETTWEIRGVMPQGFSFPDGGIDLWVPTRQSEFLQNRNAGFMNVVGRLRPGIEVEAARAELDVVVAAIDEQNGTVRERGVALRAWGEVLVAPVRRTLWVFLGAVAFFLVAACTNVAGLALSRLEGRRRELSVRRSLGATPGRIRRHLVVESTTLGLAGGVVGMVAAIWGVRVLLWLAPEDLPRQSEIGLDPALVGIGVGLALLCGVVLGLLPGLRGGLGQETAIDTRRGQRGEARLQGVVAGAQIALAVVLLFGSGLLLRSFDRLTSVETGFSDPDRVLTMEVGLGRARWGEADAVSDFHDRLLSGVRDLPGVESVAIGTHMPFSGSRLQAAMVREGAIYRRSDAPIVRIETFAGEYFETLGVDFAGPYPSSDDGALEVLVNQSAVEALHLGSRPVGTRFSFNVDEGEPPAPGSLYRVVGVVPDVLDDQLGADKAPRAYYELGEFRRTWSFISGRFFQLTVRVDGDPASVLAGVQRVLSELDPNVPIQDAQTLERRLLDTALTQRFQTIVLSFFALLAIVVALIGVHGVIAFGVKRGTREIGVRLALGASIGDVRSRVLARAGWMALGGGAVGLVGALALGSILERVLFEVDPTDPFTIVAVAGVALGGSLLAALPPAMRAAQVDPAEVMRED